MASIKSTSQQFRTRVQPQQTQEPLKTEPTAEAPQSQGVLLPPLEEQYERALTIEQKLIAASMGRAEPRALARAQQLETSLLRELQGNPHSELAKKLEANATTVDLQLQAMAAGVSQQELRETVNLSAHAFLKRGDMKGYQEMVQCAQSLDSAKSIIDDYERTLREMPRQQRPVNAGVNQDHGFGIDNLLMGMVDPLGMAAMTFMPGMIDAFGGYFNDPMMMGYGMQGPLSTAQASLGELDQTMSAGPNKLEGYYNQQALQAMERATAALAEAQAMLVQMGVDLQALLSQAQSKTEAPATGAESSTAGQQQQSAGVAKDGADPKAAPKPGPVDAFLAKGPLSHITAGEGKHGPKFALKVGKDTLTIATGKSGGLSWRLRAAGADPGVEVPRGKLDERLARLLIAQIGSGKVSDAVSANQADLSRLLQVLESLVKPT